MPDRYFGEALVVIFRIMHRMRSFEESPRKVIAHHQTGNDMGSLVGMTAKITPPGAAMNLKCQRKKKQPSKHNQRNAFTFGNFSSQ